MNSRRKFMTVCATTAAVALIPGVKASAEESSDYPSNIIYTKEDPGVWEKKAATHLPQVEVENNEVVIQTLHPMTTEHYIVRHTLVDEDGNIIGSKTFANTDKKAISSYPLPTESEGKIFYATSFCNKHDFWVNKVTL